MLLGCYFCVGIFFQYTIMKKKLKKKEKEKKFPNTKTFTLQYTAEITG